MRLAYTLIVCSAALACGSGAPLTSETESGAGSSTGPATTGATGTSTTTGETPTEASGSGLTEGVTGTSEPLTSGTGTTSGTTTTATTTTGDESTTVVWTDTGPGDTGDTTTGAEACPCPEDLDVPLDDGIFTLSKTAELWKYFPPPMNKFELLGAIDCGVAPSTFSMGVDRQGFAWVQFSDLQIRKVDVTNSMDCSDPGFLPMQDGIKNFGMAFVSNSADDKCDRLYGNHYNFVAQGKMVAEFFSIDPLSLDLVQLGKSDFGRAEVTGTGDGRAFLFAGPDPSQLVEVDKASGATLSTVPLPGVKTGGGFAFAFFAGDFYFFTDATEDGTSEVTHLDYDDSDKNGLQDLKVVLQNAPLRVVGAGVSTCAPIEPQ